MTLPFLSARTFDRPFPAGPVYLFDLVRDCPEIGGVPEFTARLADELARRIGARFVSVRSIADALGCGDPTESYLDRERRAITRLADIADPDSTFLIPNFQSPLPRRAGVPRPRIVNVVHDVQFAALPDLFTPAQRRWLHAAFEATRANADQVVFISAATRDAFLRCFGAPRRHTVIASPIRAVRKDAAGATARAPYLLAVQHASCHPHKNVAGLLDLFAALAARTDSLDLRVAGQGREAFEAEAARLPAALRARVRHHGFVPRDELDGLYTQARAFASMSRHEGFNMAAAEAACHGIPLLLSDLPAHRELFGEVACLLDPARPSVDDALAFLAARDALTVPPDWTHEALCGAEAVGRAYGRVIASLEQAVDGPPRSAPRTFARRSQQDARDLRRPRPDAGSPALRRGRLARALLAGTMLSAVGCLLVAMAPERALAVVVTPVPPVGQPGNGGDGGRGTNNGLGGVGGAIDGADGGASFGQAPPVNGSSYFGGGGGGAGQGTAGLLVPPGPGGGGGTGGGGGVAGGTSPGQAGIVGTAGSHNGANYYGGGGGGGGANGDGTVAGGAGGNGGNSTQTNLGAGGGGGGGGGAGLIVTGDYTTIGAIAGGAGGSGGSGYFGGDGNGGSGGIGVNVVGNSALVTVTNGFAITGGNGGNGGGTTGAPGVGGDGIVGANLRIINVDAVSGAVGSITGGTDGGGSTRANAINFTGGANFLRLQNDPLSGSPNISGNINIGSPLATVTFEQPGPVSIFNGSPITGAGSVIQSGPGLLTLSGNNTYTGGTTLNVGTTTQVTPFDGTLITALGTGAVTFNGGVLKVLNNFDPILANAIVLNAAGGTVDVDGASPLQLTGVISNGVGAGALTLVDSTGNGGTVVIGNPGNAPNTYSGGTILGDAVSPESVIVQLAATNALGTGGLTFLGTGSTLDLGGFDQALTQLTGAAGTITNTGTRDPNNVVQNTLRVASGNFGGTIADGIVATGDDRILRTVGTIALVKVSPGTLVLAGANPYSGGTTINAGTLAILHADGTGAYDAAGTAEIALNGGALAFGLTGTLNNPLTVFAGATAATRAVPGALATIAGPLTIGANATLIVGGPLDTGTIVLAGGTPTLGANAGLTVNGGTLQAGAGNAGLGFITANAATTRVNRGTLDFNGNSATIANLQGTGGTVTNAAGATTTINAGSYGGGIAGGGAVVTTGVVLLTGTSPFTGPTTVASGILEVGGGGAVTASGSLANAGIFQVDAGGSAAFGTIGNTGVLATAGSLTAGSLVDSGTVNVSGALSLGSVTNTGAFNVLGPVAGGVGSFNQSQGVLGLGGQSFRVDSLNLSGGTVANGTLIAASAFNISGGLVTATLAGTGTLTKSGPGTLLLSNANSFTGGTVLNAGTIAIGNNNALGTGGLAFNGGALQAGAAGLTLSNPASLGRGGGTIDTQSFGFTDAGAISGAGALTKLGAGTLLLSNANSFGGGTSLNAGTIAVGNNNALGTGGLTFNGGALQAGADGLTLSNPASLASNGTIDTQGFSLTYAGAISGAGSLSKQGTGTLVLPNGSGFGGGTFLNAGTIAVGNNNALGTGGLTVNGGTLQAAADGLTLDNPATLAASGTIDTQGFALTYAGTISGSGALGKQGAGTLLLPGANSFGGGTFLNAGTIAVGNSGSLGAGGLTFNGGTLQAAADGLTLNTAAALLKAGTIDTQAFNLTYAGAISGAGALAKVGGGTLLLPDANGYTGGTLLRAGTLAVGNTDALGTGALRMDDNTTLAFTANLTLPNAIVFTGVQDPTIDTGANTDIVAGPISGGGALTKSGGGTLILTANNPYTGPTTVQAGTLAVNGADPNSTVLVANGATLGGTGTVGSTTVNGGGTLAPGVLSPYGTLNVSGNLAFQPNATFRVNLNGSGADGRVSSAGAATIGGGTLDVVLASGGFNPAAQYAVLSAAGGLTGRFANVTNNSNLAFLNVALIYEPNALIVGFNGNGATFPSVAGSPNQAAVAAAIQGLGPSNPLYDAILGQTAAGARQAFDAASGEVHASATTAAVQDARIVSTFLFDRLWNVVGSGLDARQLLDKLGPQLAVPINCYAPIPGSAPVVPLGYTAWGEAFGNFGGTRGNGNAASLERSLGGFVLGVDTQLSTPGTPWRVGVAGGYTSDAYGVKDRSSSGTFESIFGSVYGGARYGAVDIRLGAAFGGNTTDDRRTVAFPGFAESEHARYGGGTIQGFGELGYRFQFPRAVLEPVVGAATVHVHQDGFRETGGIAALAGTGRDTDVQATTLGVRAEAAPFKDLPLVARAFLGWRHAFGDLDPKSVLAFEAGGNNFSTSGVPIDRDALAAEAGFEYRASANVTLGLAYIGQVGKNASDNSVKGRAEYRF